MLETPARIEPCGIEEAVPDALSDLVLKIKVAAGDLGSGLHEDTAAELRGVMRIANSFFSNLIEGHRVSPFDIEHALAGHRRDIAATAQRVVGPFYRAAGATKVVVTCCAPGPDRMGYGFDRTMHYRAAGL